MPIIKSRKTAFIIKLVLLFPLSIAACLVAGIATGGGHGNYLPFMVIMGPVNILFALNLGPSGVFWAMCGVVCLYETYALLLRFVKPSFIVPLVFLFHVGASLIAILYSPSHFPLFIEPMRGASDIALLLFLYGIIFIPLALIIWVLTSIRKSSNDATSSADGKQAGRASQIVPRLLFALLAVVLVGVAGVIKSGSNKRDRMMMPKAVEKKAECLWRAYHDEISIRREDDSQFPNVPLADLLSEKTKSMLAKNKIDLSEVVYSPANNKEDTSEEKYLLSYKKDGFRIVVKYDGTLSVMRKGSVEY